MKKITLFTSLIIGCISLFVSCSSDDDTSQNLAQVNIDFNFLVGSDNFTPGETYSIGGEDVQIDIMQFYVGGLKMTSSTDEEFSLSGYHIISSTNDNIAFGEVAIGDNNDFEFIVGVDSATNGQSEDDFSTRPANDPLSMQEPSMHWNWNSGYKFLRIDGMIGGQAFKYHIGTDNLLVNLNIDDAINVAEGGSTIIVQVDIAQFFNGIDVAAGESTMTMDNLPLATQVVGNYTSAFSVGQ